MKLKIKVTKDILEKSKSCQHKPTSCAVANSVRDIFPDVSVLGPYMYVTSAEFGPREKIILPENVASYIATFDTYKSDEERAAMPEIEFEIEIPEEIINSINIDELRPLLDCHKNLEIVS